MPPFDPEGLLTDWLTDISIRKICEAGILHSIAAYSLLPGILMQNIRSARVVLVCDLLGVRPQASSRPFMLPQICNVLLSLPTGQEQDALPKRSRRIGSTSEDLVDLHNLSVNTGKYQTCRRALCQLWQHAECRTKVLPLCRPKARLVKWPQPTIYTGF